MKKYHKILSGLILMTLILIVASPLRLKAKDVDSLFNVANILYNETKYDEAREIFLEITRSNESNSLSDQSHYMAGMTYLSQENYQSAIEKFMELYNKKGSTKQPEALWGLGNAYVALKEFNRAKYYLNRLIVFFPENSLYPQVKAKLTEIEEKVKSSK
ncbi:tetratricopeptide repeat protein [bacterium]|nr:tetratricopeptide repeat protein [bacterium]